MATHVSISDDISSSDKIITAHIEDLLNPNDKIGPIQRAIQEIAKKYADEWIENNLSAIYKQLNVEAISNLIMVEVAKQVKDNIVKEKK